MKVYFGQIYTEPGVSFPWSLRFQQWLSDKVSVLAASTSDFINRYGDDWSLMLRISAKRGIVVNEIRGPTVFTRDKDVEISIFLPFEQIPMGREFAISALQFLLDGVDDVFVRVGIEGERFRIARGTIVEDYLQNLPSLIDINEG